MATARTLFFLGLVLLFCSLIGASHGPAGTRRSLSKKPKHVKTGKTKITPYPTGNVIEDGDKKSNDKKSNPIPKMGPAIPKPIPTVVGPAIPNPMPKGRPVPIPVLTGPAASNHGPVVLDPIQNPGPAIPNPIQNPGRPMIPNPQNLGPRTIFDVTKFGARADGKTDNRQAFTAAWIQACKNSNTPAKVLIPAGTYLTTQTFFAGPCTSPGPIVVEVIGTVIAGNLVDMSDDDSEWFAFQNINGLVLTGSGIFDGRGPIYWAKNDCKGNGCPNLPAALKFLDVNNSVVTGITSRDSMMFHFHIHRCNNIEFTNLKLQAPGESPNTDGMHISRSTNIKVSNSIIGTGDDCISVGHGTTNIAITNITCGPGHGISVGSLGKRDDEESVVGVTVTDCTFINTTNGARIKTYIGSRPMEARNIVYERLTMNGVKNPIVIDQSYGTDDSKGPSRSVWKISDVHFRDIRGTTTSIVAVNLQCSSQRPCEGIEVANVNLVYTGILVKKPFMSTCINAKTIFGGILNPPRCL